MDAAEQSTLEQNLHSLAVQRQTLEQQLLEIDLALKELQNARTAYKLVGGLLIESDAASLRADLEKKKEVAQTRLSTLARHAEKLSAKRAH